MSTTDTSPAAPDRIVLATRGSALALWQADAASRALRAAHRGLAVEVLEVRSSGDADQATDLARFGRIGIFTVEVDRAVVEGRADVAVHSLKDMVTDLPSDRLLSGVLGRAPVEDALVSRDGAGLADLPRGAKVATGSLRRAAMLRAQRPDLELVQIRGNVETRLAKVAAGEADATVLACAGLARLGLADRITEVLDTDRFLPAVGQGIVGLVCAHGAWATHGRVAAVRDLEAWHEALAERAFLRELRGGCNVAVGGHARVVEGALNLRGRVLSPDGAESLEGELTGPRDEAESLGRALGQELLARGADRLVALSRA